MDNLEDRIRDKIAFNLKIISDDFELIDTEFYIPKAKTTKSFIDILAKNKDNDYIIIEVKRSNQSSRQAIHEIYKYTEAIKEKYKVTSGEIQAYIISTEWKELYIPFSAFVNESNISLKGIKIEIDEDENIISTEMIIPCKTNEGRLFSRIQDCHLYLNEENLEKGIQSHKEILSKKQFENYVLVILKGAKFDKEKIKSGYAHNACKYAWKR